MNQEVAAWSERGFAQFLSQFRHSDRSAILSVGQIAEMLDWHIVCRSRVVLDIGWGSHLANEWRTEVTGDLLIHCPEMQILATIKPWIRECPGEASFFPRCKATASGLGLFKYIAERLRPG